MYLVIAAYLLSDPLFHFLIACPSTNHNPGLHFNIGVETSRQALYRWLMTIVQISYYHRVVQHYHRVKSKDGLKTPQMQ